MVNAGVIGAIAIVAVIVASFGSYYVTATPLQSSISSLQTNASEYQSVIASMSAHPSTTTILSTITQTVTSTLTIVSTSTAYPIPDNVTVYFQNSGTPINYAINTASQSYTGSTSNTAFSIPITPVFAGEKITITASCVGTCGVGLTFSATLYVNKAIVSQANGNAYGGLSISYIL
ncbi:MAG: hypothetical protein ABSE82_08155 [Nitrososphaerales archaeon]|jgi:hypothetical protein